MASEIRTGFTSGNTLTAVIRRKSDFYVWYPTGGVWEVFGTGARTNADYDIALVDKTGDWYVGDFDANITDPANYDVLILIGGVYAGIQGLEWSGSARDESAKKLANGAGWIGDCLEDSTISFFWESGIVTASGGTTQVYKNNGTTPCTVPTGVTETLNFNSVTGKHRIELDLSANAFYVKNADFSVVRNAVTVFGQVITLVIAEFSIEHRYEHKPFRPGG